MMRRAMSGLLWIILCVVLLWGAFQTVRIISLLRESARLTHVAAAYSQEGRSGGASFLIAGDSTGVGVGAGNPRSSVAGRLGTEFPKTNIHNISVSGLTLAEVTLKLQALQEHYDFILLQVGANDVVEFTSLPRVRADATALLRAAVRRADQVVWMSSGDVGLSPLFPWPLNELWRSRSRVVRDIFINVATEAGVVYVDLYRSRADEPFIKDIPKYFAADRFHPSGEGYALWYEELKRTAGPTLSRYAQPSSVVGETN